MNCTDEEARRLIAVMSLVPWHKDESVGEFLASLDDQRRTWINKALPDYRTIREQGVGENKTLVHLLAMYALNVFEPPLAEQQLELLGAAVVERTGLVPQDGIASALAQRWIRELTAVAWQIWAYGESDWVA